MPFVNVVHGDRLPPAPFNIAVPAVRISRKVFALWWTGRTIWAGIKLAYRHPWYTVPAIASLTGLWLLGRTTTALVAAGLLVALVGWGFGHRPSFMTVVGWRWLAAFRRNLIYGRQWVAATTTTGLAVQVLGEKYIPKLVKVRTNTFGDTVTVRLLAGQHPADWVKAAPRLAYTFGARTAHAAPHPKRLDRLVLTFQRRDPLADIVAPLPVPVVTNLAALPVAVTETGAVFALQLAGNHVLIGGATGSGKGSAVSATLAALAPGIRAGLMKVWGFDPKGGMELAPSAGLFDRFVYGTPDEMAASLDDAAKLMFRRADRLRGRTRQHVASVDDPTHVLVIDELAALTAYISDRKLRDRIRDTLALILSQGRAVGVHVIAAVQDVRKEVVSMRDLFPTRIALRLTETDQTNLILGDDATGRGADCALISQSTPGVAYVRTGEGATPIRVRFPYLSDTDLGDLVANYTHHLDEE